MAVIIQYVVERDGQQVKTFTTKKDADAYDKMLDIADGLFAYIKSSDVELDEDKLDGLATYLAKNSDEVIAILRGTSLKKAPKQDVAEADDVAAADKDKVTKIQSVKKGKAA